MRHVMEQPGLTELREDLKGFKRRTEAQIESVTAELAIVKNCIMQLYNVLLPGKFCMQHLHAAPVMPEMPVPAQLFPSPAQVLAPLQQPQMASSGQSSVPLVYPHLAAVPAATLLLSNPGHQLLWCFSSISILLLSSHLSKD